MIDVSGCESLPEATRAARPIRDREHCPLGGNGRGDRRRSFPQCRVPQRVGHGARRFGGSGPADRFRTIRAPATKWGARLTRARACAQELEESCRPGGRGNPCRGRTGSMSVKGDVCSGPRTADGEPGRLQRRLVAHRVRRGPRAGRGVCDPPRSSGPLVAGADESGGPPPSEGQPQCECHCSET